MLQTTGLPYLASVKDRNLEHSTSFGDQTKIVHEALGSSGAVGAKRCSVIFNSGCVNPASSRANRGDDGYTGRKIGPRQVSCFGGSAPGQQ